MRTKHIILSAAIAASILSSAACEKVQTAVEEAVSGSSQTVSATVAAGGTYRYALPGGSAASYAIVIPPTSGAGVSITEGVYQYAAQQNFAGTEVVEVVATTTDSTATGSGCSGGGRGRGGSGDGPGTTRTCDTLTFQMTVTDGTTASNQ